MTLSQLITHASPARETPDDGAVATDRPAVDQHHVVTETRQADGERAPAGAGTDDCCLVGASGVVTDHEVDPSVVLLGGGDCV